MRTGPVITGVARIMIRVIVAIEFGEAASEDEMIAAFAQGEVDSPRFGRHWQDMLTQRARTRSIVDHADLLNPVDNNIRRDMLTTFRRYPDRLLFQGFPSDVVWYHGLVPRRDVGHLLYARFNTWLILSGGTRLVRVGAANVGTIAIGDDGTNEFIREACRLIAVGTDLGRPVDCYHQ
jgi:hypothetical protein